MRRRARWWATLGGAAACRVAGGLAVWLPLLLIPAPNRAAPHANIVFAGLFAVLSGSLLFLRELVVRRDALRPVRVASAIGLPLLASLLGLLPAYALYAACGRAGHALLTGSALQRSGGADGFLVFVGCALARLLWASAVGAACGLGRLGAGEWGSRGRSAALGGALGAGLGSLVYEAMLALGAGPLAAGAGLGLLLGLGVELAEWLGPVAWLDDADGRSWGVHAPHETLGRSLCLGASGGPDSGARLVWRPKPAMLMLVREGARQAAPPREGEAHVVALPDGARLSLSGGEYTVRWNRLRVAVGAEARADVGAVEAGGTCAGVLVVLSGASAGRRLELTEGTLTLGSDRGCDFVLADPSIAPLHASVLVREGTVTVRDEGGGILVAGVGAATASLTDGTRLRLGEVEAIFLTGSEAGE